MNNREINLLPDRKQRGRAYRALGIGVGYFFRWVYSSLAVMTIAMVLILAAVTSIQELVLSEGRSAESGIGLESTVTTANGLVAYMEMQNAEFVPWTNRMEQILADLPVGVKIVNILKIGDESKVEIVAVTNQRVNIGRFREKLESFEWVYAVESPLQNFTVGSSSEFTLIINLEEEAEDDKK